MANVCTNIIHITYYGSGAAKLLASKNLFQRIESKFLILSEHVYGHLEPDPHNPINPITQLVFLSEWVAPIEFLQSLCYEFMVDIRGVSMEFIDGYVDCFELFNKLEDVKTGSHWVKLQAEEGASPIIPLEEDEPIQLNDDQAYIE